MTKRIDEAREPGKLPIRPTVPGDQKGREPLKHPARPVQPKDPAKKP